ncbi:MAG: hypothetical protein AAGH40_07035, partial [Verrucomicrobiota bacterium]
MTEIESIPPLVPEHFSDEGQVLFYPTAPWKFTLLNICTFGIYGLYWAYRCWVFVRDGGRPGILPFWRAFFLPIWFYALGQEIDETRSKPGLFLLAISYFLLGSLGSLSNPYWLISFLVFVPILPLLKDVNALNQEAGVRAGSNYSRFGFKHIAVSLTGSLLICLAVASTFNVTPSTAVVDGDALPEWHRKFMIEINALEEDEEIYYFYSLGVWSLKEDGNYITDRGVGSYWKELFGSAFYTNTASYGEIEDIHVTYSDSLLEDTIATITTKDGQFFDLYISNEAERDHLFVDKMMECW